MLIQKNTRTHARARARAHTHTHTSLCPARTSSNNQAEQVAILKALEQLPPLEAPTGGNVAIYRDSKVAIDSLKNYAKHGFLIEK